MAMLELWKKQFTSPVRAFVLVHEGFFEGEACLSFLLAALVTLYKSFRVPHWRNNFFQNDVLDLFLTVLAIPQVWWLIACLSFLVYLLLVRRSMRFLGPQQPCFKSLLPPFLALSSYGLFMHVFFEISRYVLPPGINRALFFIACVFLLGVMVLGMRDAYTLRPSKAMRVILLPAIPCYLLSGFPGIFPSVMMALWVPLVGSTPM